MPIGGVARRATLIRNERESAEHVLVLDAGDALLNDKVLAKTTRGKSSIEVMNLMGYDAMTLGMRDLSLLSTDELQQRISEAEFPVLSANAFLTNSTQLLTEPYVVLEMADHHVGILGLTESGSTDAVLVSDPAEAVAKWLPEVRGKADIVILLSHAGLDTDRLIAQQSMGIDLVVSGGNITTPEAIIVEGAGTLIVHAEVSSAGHAGRVAGIAQLTFDKTGHLTQHDWRKQSLSGDLKDDPIVTEWLQSVSLPSSKS